MPRSEWETLRLFKRMERQREQLWWRAVKLKWRQLDWPNVGWRAPLSQIAQRFIVKAPSLKKNRLTK